MKILIASDKFKGSLDALNVCQAIADGLLLSHKNLKCKILPLADGGDGTLHVLQNCFEYNKVTLETIDPLHRKIKASYLSDSNTAFIELAEASGMANLDKTELNILKTTTIGTGILMMHALDNNHKEIVLSVGGSCTNDAGLGIAYALGFTFWDENKKSIVPSGSNIHQIKTINPPQKSIDIPITILCDVENPLFGKNGAAQIYGPQKGATLDDIILLDKSMMHITEVIQNQFGKNISTLIGGGAAGGIPAGLFGLLKNTTLKNGFAYISLITNLEEKIKSADLVVTGEGQLDSQSLQGKIVYQVASICHKYQVPVVAVVGGSKLTPQEKEKLNIKSIYEVIHLAKNLEDAMLNCNSYLIEIGKKILEFA
jgi:glycerate kinase